MGTLHERRLWRRTGALTAGLLGCWLLVALAGPWFARYFDGMTFGGFPVGYWLVAQGALLAFVAIVVVYALRMDLIEAERRAAPDQDPQPSAGPGPAAT